MSYEIHGAGRPLVQLHGSGSTIQSTFGRILPALARTHRVIAVELQAHGHTRDIDRPLSFAQDADDVAKMTFRSKARSQDAIPDLKTVCVVLLWPACMACRRE